MTVTKYTTNNKFVLKSEPVFPSATETGAAKHIITEGIVCNSFNGFGVALTGASCYNLMQMEKEERQKLLKYIYTEEGLNLSVARIPVGSCDYSAEIYTYDDGPNDTELKHFSIERDRAYILPMIKEIISIKPDLKLFASPWSPPGWMKTGGSICGGVMRQKYIKTYAEYIIKFIKAYKAEGINISVITPQNEPEVDQWGMFPACKWHPEHEVEYVLTLSKRLKEENLDVDIWFYDHNFDGWRRVDWCLTEYPEIKKCCSSVAWHYYSGTIEMIDAIKEHHPQIKFQYTEGGPRLYDHYADDWCKWASMICKTLNRGFESFTGWNLMLDEEGRPNIGHCYCGGLVTLNSQTKELSYSGQFRTFEHFSHFIKKGAKLYKSYPTHEGRNMSAFRTQKFETETCVADNIDGSHVIIVSNPNEEKRQYQYFYKGNWWYFDVMENSVSTIIFKD